MRRSWRWWYVTAIFNSFRRLSLDELGREWGEAEWTADDLWRLSP